MRSAAYWEKRAIAVMGAGMASADKVLKGLQKAYDRAEKQVLGQIESLYARYAGRYGLTYDQAIKSIAESEYRQWRMTVAEYVERIMATGDQELLREFDTLSTRSRVTRLEQVEAAIKVNVAELRARQEQMVTELLHSTYEKSYYRTAYNIQKALGFGKTLELLNPMDVANACAYPWSGASFSERIWTNTDALARELRETITVGLIRGTGIDEMTRSIRDKMGVSFSAAERIIRTETARVVEDAELQSYKDCGIDRYEILVQLDERTCKTCGPKDGQQHAVKSARMGENYPPFHPRCRCTTVAVFDDLVTEGSMRAAKEGKGGYRLVPADMTFEEWRDLFVDKSPFGDKIKLSDIEIPRNLGAAAFRDTVKLPSGKLSKITEGTKITKVVVFAGKGTKRPVEVAKYLSRQYGVPESEWRKVRGDGYVDDGDESRHAELHWFEADGVGRVQMKVKRWFDES